MRRLMLTIITTMLVVTALGATRTSTALAGQEKVAVCHPDKNGNYEIKWVAGKALSKHLEHGDPVVGEDVDENCEPLPLARAGCFLLLISESALYYPTDGSTVQSVAYEPLYTDATCETPSESFGFRSDDYLIWAETYDEAESRCMIRNPQGSFTDPSLTPKLYICYGFNSD